MITVSRTPLRISLVGGGTDQPSFYEKHGGSVISFAISKYVYIIVKDSFDGNYRISYSENENVEKISQIRHPIVRNALQSFKFSRDKHLPKSFDGMEIVSIADIPGKGSGLGSSSAFTVGLLKALIHRNYNNQNAEPAALAPYAFRVEQESNPSIGKQDHMAAAFGGFRMYDFSPMGGVRSKEIVPMWDKNPWSWNELSSSFLLLWTGITRESKDLLKKQSDNFASGNSVAIGKDMLQLVDECYKHLVNGQIKEVAKDLHAGWHMKRKLADGIDNEWINLMYQKAMLAGAWGGKLCGAGGGGFLFFMAPPDTHKGIIQVTGLRKVDFSVDYEGSVIIERRGWTEF